MVMEMPQRFAGKTLTRVEISPSFFYFKIFSASIS
jgi:hypothetical protein